MNDVYLRAAQRIAMNYGDISKGMKGGCCGALYYVKASGPEHDEFAAIFRPPFLCDAFEYWWPADDYSDQQARVLALLFMHWMQQDK